MAGPLGQLLYNLNGFTTSNSNLVFNIEAPGTELITENLNVNSNSILNGNVGVHTTNPRTYLDVNGYSIITAQGNNSQNTYEFGLNGPFDSLCINSPLGLGTGGTASIFFGLQSMLYYPIARIVAKDENGKYTGSLGFQTGNAQAGSAALTERMRIHTNGYIGINCNSPQFSLDVNGNTNIQGDLTVIGSLNLVNTTLNLSSITGNFSVSGLTTLSSLVLGGSFTISELNILSTLNFPGDLKINGILTLSTIYNTGIFTAYGQTILSNTSNLGDLFVLGSTITFGTLAAQGYATLSTTSNLGNLSVLGSTIASGTLAAQGYTTLSTSSNVGDLSVLGSTIAFGTLAAQGLTILSSLILTGNATLSNVTVTGDQILNNLTVNNIATLSTTSNVGNFSVLGTTIAIGSFVSEGLTTLFTSSNLGDLTIQGSTISLGTLAAQGYTTLSTTSVSGDLSVQQFTTLSNVLVTGNGTFSSLTIIGNQKIPNLIIDNTTTLSTLIVNGTTTFLGDSSVLGSTISLGTFSGIGQSILSTTSNLGDLSVLGSTISLGTFSGIGQTILSNVSTLGDTTLNNLTVTGSTIFSNLTVQQSTIAAESLTASRYTILSTTSNLGDFTVLRSTISLGSFTATGSTILSRLYTINNATFQGSTIANGALAAYGFTTLSNVSTLGSVSIRGNLNVSQITTLSSFVVNSFNINNLLVSQLTTLSTSSNIGNFTIGGSLTVQKLGVFNLGLTAYNQFSYFNFGVQNNNVTNGVSINYNVARILGNAEFLCAAGTGGTGSFDFYAGLTNAANVLPQHLAVSINKASNATTLFVRGGITATQNTGTISDVRIKTNIETIPYALEKIKALRGVYYNRTDTNEPDQRHLGVIAQEVEKIIPEVVMTDSSKDKNKSVAYGNIVGLLIEGIKELSQKVVELENQIKHFI